MIAPDLRGHGDSAWSPDGDYTGYAFVYDFAQLVHSLGYDQVSIVAHSLGGNIATQFAGLYPEKVRKLVNIEGLGPSPELQAEIEARAMPCGCANGSKVTRRRRPHPAQLRDDRGCSRADAGRERLPHRRTGPPPHPPRRHPQRGRLLELEVRQLPQCLAGDRAAPDDVHALWQAIGCPVLLLYGADSGLEPGERRPGRHFRFGQVIEYADAGHWLHHDQFERFVGDLRAFL